MKLKRRTQTTSMGHRLSLIALLMVSLFASAMPAWADNIAEGTSGTCKWTIDAEGDLRITPLVGDTGTLDKWEVAPWAEYKSSIKNFYANSGKVINIKSCEGLFEGCTNLSWAVMGDFRTDSVTSMRNMFNGCTALNNLNVSSFNTERVTDMSGMFKDCSAYSDRIEMANFDTRNVTDMSGMFQGCTNLTGFEWGNFTTANANIDNLFTGCNSISSLELTADTPPAMKDDLFSSLPDISGLSVYFPDSEDVKEEYYKIPLWYQFSEEARFDMTNEEIWEDFNDPYYKEEIVDVLYSDKFEYRIRGYERVTLDVNDYLSYKSIIKYKAVRDSLKSEYEKMYQDIYKKYMAGELASYQGYTDMNKRRMDFAHAVYNICDIINIDFNEEYCSHKYRFVQDLSVTHEYLPDHNSYDNDLTTYWQNDCRYDSETDNYPGYVAYRFFQDEGIVKYKLTFPVNEKYSMVPGSWYLYGYNNTGEETPDYHNVDKWTLIDFQENTKDLTPGVAHEFTINNPGIYNRFLFSFYKPDNWNYDGTWYYMGVAEVDFIEGELPEGMTANVPDPVIPKFTPILNEGKYDEYYKKVQIASTIGQGGSNLRWLNGGRVNVVYKHVDPQYGIKKHHTFIHPTTFNSDGLLEFDLFDEEQQGALFNAETFPNVNGHACDIIITGQAIGTLTGKTYNICDTIPYYIGGYPKPEVTAEKNTVWGTSESREGKYTAELKNLDIVRGFTVNVDIEDYASGSYSKRTLSFTYNNGDYSQYFGNNDEWEKPVAVDGYDWLKLIYNYDMRFNDKALGGISLSIPVTCKENGTDAKITITATNNNGGETNTAVGIAEYKRFQVDDYFKATYTCGYDHKTAPVDISLWRTSNAAEAEALTNAIKQDKSSEEIELLHSIYNESMYREVTYSAPTGWGMPEIHYGDYSCSGNVSSGIFTIVYGKKVTAQPVTIEWPEVGASKTLSFTPATIADEDHYYCIRPVIDEGSEQQSVTVEYLSTKREAKRISRTGNFDVSADKPELFYFYDKDGMVSYSPVIVHNNSSQTMGRVGSRYFGFGIFTTKNYSYPEQHYVYASGIKSPISYLAYEPIEVKVKNDPVMRIQVLNEDGTAITNKQITVTIAYINQPSDQEQINIGTSPTYNPFTKHAQYSLNVDCTDGVVEFALPTPTDGTVNHPFIEFYDRNKEYDSRLICELTTPEAFTDYIEKGLAYPCVLQKVKNRRWAEQIRIRHKDKPLFSSDDDVSDGLHGSEVTYESGTHRWDMLLRNVDNNPHYKDKDITLADGTTEKSWRFYYRFKLMAPRLAAHNREGGWIEWTSSNSFHWVSGDRYYNEYIDNAEIARDANGRSILWPEGYTNFCQMYMLVTSDAENMIPPMFGKNDKPKGENVTLACFKDEDLDANGDPINSVSGKARYSWDIPITFAYNSLVDETDYHHFLENIVDNAQPGYNKDAVSKDKKLDKVRGGMSSADELFSTPVSIPFAQILVTKEKNLYRLRSCFEYNVLDNIPGYDQYSKYKGYIEDASTYLERFFALKYLISGDYIENAADPLPDAFVGFKGFVEMALDKNPATREITPYFTGFGVKAEASANLCWALQAPPFIAKMSTQFEMSSAFMILNPHPKDYILELAKSDPNEPVSRSDFQPLSNYNLYLTSTFDLSLKLQAGIGFDAGFIAAHGGLQGECRAAMRSALVRRLYMNSDNYKTAAGFRFNASASLSAYAYFKFLFFKYTKEWPICSAETEYYWPEDNSNPFKTDPNLNSDLLEVGNAKVKVRPLTTTYNKRQSKRRVSVIGERTISDKVDIFANPMYLNGGRRLAFLNINDPENANDDRVMISGDNCNVNTGSEDLYEDKVPAFTYNAASAGEHQIIAVQRLAQQLKAGDDDMDAAANLTNKLQIVASIGEESSDDYEPTVVSTEGTANTDPKAAIAQNGNAAVVWASGDITVNEEDDGEGGTYKNPYMTGNIVLSQYNNNYGMWSSPVKLVPTSKSSQVKDYAIAIGNKLPLVMASVPGVDNEGNATAPTYFFTVNNGFMHQTPLGSEGAMHQLVAVYDNGGESTNHFIASSLVNIDTKGTTDIQLYDITVNDNGTVSSSSLGRLGLFRNRILSYRLVSPKEGATGVDGLGIIWNEHEQVNTDDETLEAVSYNRTYVARINRRGNYVYLSHAAQALDLDDAHSVADMTAYMDYDNTLKCPVVVSAFCVGETQTGDASTAAQIIEKKVSLNNEIEWLEAQSGLSGSISRVKGADIKLALLNKGLHTIKKVKVVMAGVTSEHTVNLAPSSRSSVTVHVPGKTNFDNAVPFTMTADFYNVDVTDPTDAGEFTESVSINGAVKINVVDMCASVLTNRLDTISKKDVVTVAISNISPMALKAGSHVKVSLFTDALGDTQYGSVGTYDIPLSQLYDSNSKRNLVKTVKFVVPVPDSRTVVYAVCHTLDADGNVIFDQSSTNNTIAVVLTPSTYGTATDELEEADKPTVTKLVHLIEALNNRETVTGEMDYDGNSVVDWDDVEALKNKILEKAPNRLSVSDLQNPRLKVKNQGESVVVEGLNAAKDVKIFDANGRLIKWTEPNSEKATISVKRKGQLIIVNDGKAGVIRH